MATKDEGSRPVLVHGFGPMGSRGLDPDQMCDECGIGPFFYVAARLYPALCLDCADVKVSAERLTDFA